MSADLNPARSVDLGRIRAFAVIVGVAGLVLCGVGSVVDRPRFLQSYLLAYVFWVGLALGALPLALLRQLVGGAWTRAIRSPVEAAMLTIPLMALLFIPIAVNVETLYPWADPGSELYKSHIVQAKRPYLNVPFFQYRALGTFLFWSLLAVWLRRDGKAEDRGNEAATWRLHTFSGPAMLFQTFAVSFMAVDWIMSLEPEWYSTIFGPLWMAGQVFSMLAVSILVVGNGAPEPEPTQKNGIFLDLGNMLLALTMLWAYAQLSQYLIIWSGNLLEEIPWYLKRTQNGWQWVAITLIVSQFFLPFLVLLQRQNKRRPARLVKLAALIVVLQYLATYWIVDPAYHPNGPQPHWLDIAAPVGIGGVWLAAFLWLIGRDGKEVAA